MERVDYLIVGAGVSGLSFANAIREECHNLGKRNPEILVIEADDVPGGYCKTVVQDGFTWDYSGHFFHFRHPEIEAWLRQRMPGQDIRTVQKQTKIRYGDLHIDFPFQKHIHQLERDDFIDCLVSLYFRDQGGPAGSPPSSFRDLIDRRYGRGIAERFLVPYNEKLYACDLNTLDVDAMGRFFPHADIADIIGNMQSEDTSSYNSSFCYPTGGAIQFIHALLHDLPPEVVAYSEALTAVDTAAKIATTTKRQISYRHLVSSAPFPALCAATGVSHQRDAFGSNQVLIYNLGFDKKGKDDVHWIYVPDRSLPFYRIGFYDNIVASKRMSLYVEIGAPSDQTFAVDRQRDQVLAGLRRLGYVTDHKLVSWHSVVLDPAYVHITSASLAEHQRLDRHFREQSVYAVGRYGGWTYCSIEDNIIETRALAKSLADA